MKRNNQNGYTLVEILIAIQLFAIVISLSYTIYLYSIRFMGRWHQNNALTTSYILLDRALDSKFNALKQIIEISETRMLLDCGKDGMEQIEWINMNFAINDKNPAAQDVKIKFKSLTYFIRKNNTIKPASFAELDKDGNKKLLADELKGIKAIAVSMELIGKKKKTDFHYFKSLNFPPL